jgi:hypothetical protein
MRHDWGIGMKQAWTQVRRWPGWHRISAELRKAFVTLPAADAPQRGWRIAGLILGRLLALLLLGILASMIVMWFSRRREFRADESAPHLQRHVSLAADPGER